MVWDIYSVDMHGHILAHHSDAVLTEWSDILDDYKGGFKFKMPDISPVPYAGALTEFQLYRNGKFFDWGVSVKPKSTPNTDGVLEVQCNSILWYFFRRVFGSANPRSFLVNGDFEVDPPGILTPSSWIATNLASSTIETDTFLTGSKAVRLVNNTEQADAFLQQVIAHQTGVIGDYGVLTAWFFLEQFLAPAYQQRGIYLDTVIGGVSQGPAWFPLTASQPTNVWTRVQSAGFLPASTLGGYDLRLYCPKGHIVYDTCAFNFEDSISSGILGEDQAILIQAIIIYAQSAAWGKSDLNIGLDIPLTGVPRILSYLFTDNKKIWDALLEFTKYVDGVDIGIDFLGARGVATPGNVNFRNFKTWSIIAGSSMGRGTVWGNEMLLQVNVSVEEVEPAQDGDQITTAMIIQSGNAGTGREQGGYVDASHYGGLILETVEQAPESLSLNGLAGLAKKRLLQLNSGANIPVLKTRETIATPIIGKLQVGDTVPVQLNYGGWATWQDHYRVVKMQLDPVADALDLTLNIVSL